ncbi:hypothetical protein MRX96_018046 [Rhipicephalus microplus]
MTKLILSSRLLNNEAYRQGAPTDTCKTATIRAPRPPTTEYLKGPGITATASIRLAAGGVLGRAESEQLVYAGRALKISLQTMKSILSSRLLKKEAYRQGAPTDTCKTATISAP